MTKFEGLVNGVSYDTVEEYNDAVQKAMESGENFSASTRTYTVDETAPTCGCEAQSCEGVCVCDSNYWNPPVFDLDQLDAQTDVDQIIESIRNSKLKQEFIDELKSEHDITKIKKMVSVVNDLEKKLHDTEFSQNLHRTNIQNMRCELDELEKRINALANEIADHERNLNILQKAEDVLKEEISFYDEILENVQKEHPQKELMSLRDLAEKELDKYLKADASHEYTGIAKLLKAIVSGL